MSMKHTYLVTGATGFIGSHCLDYLIDEQKIPETSIRLIVRNKEKIHRKGKYEIIEGNLESESVCKKATSNVDTIIHIAAMSGFGGTTLEDYRRGNLLPTKNLLDSIRTKKIHKFCFISSIAVYGLPSGIGNIINWNETHPHTFTEIYGQSKHETELIVLKHYKQYGTPYTIIRPTSVYGPRDKGQLYSLIQSIAKKYFFIIGDGKNKMDFVYITDLLNGIFLALNEKSKQSDYILGSGNPTEFNMLVSIIAKKLNISSQFLHIPKHFALPVSYVADHTAKLLGVTSPIFPSRVKILTSSYYYSIDKAKTNIHYNPIVSIDDGIKKTINWYTSL